MFTVCLKEILSILHLLLLLTIQEYMSSFIHKTLSFVTGAAIAYGGYLYLSDQIVLSVNTIVGINNGVAQPFV